MLPSPVKVVLLTALALSAFAAQATTIDFENFAPPNSLYQQYTNTSFSPAPGYTFHTTGEPAVFKASVYGNGYVYAGNGTDYLYLNNYRNDTVTLTRDVNQLFTVHSIDLTNWVYNGDPQYDSTAILTGTFADGSSIVASFFLNNRVNLTLNDFNTEKLTGFVNLTSFSIDNTGGPLDVDNIVVTEVAAVAVPEPASLAIFGLGLFGIVAFHRRKAVTDLTHM